jgi:hypothetical protein
MQLLLVTLVRTYIAIIFLLTLLLFYIVFIDTSIITTATPTATAESFINPTATTVATSCSNTSTICSNPNECCLIQNNTYFCRHPAVKLCRAEHAACTNSNIFNTLYSNQLKELKEHKCKEQLNTCCTTFDMIAPNTTKFEKLPRKTQSQHLLGTYLNLTDDSTSKCTKLCATDPLCVAVTVSGRGCDFFSTAATPLINSIDTSSIYYKKL